MWLWILSALIVAVAWGGWYILRPTTIGGAELVSVWVPIAITALVVLVIVGIFVFRRIRAARAASTSVAKPPNPTAPAATHRVALRSPAPRTGGGSASRVGPIEALVSCSVPLPLMSNPPVNDDVPAAVPTTGDAAAQAAAPHATQRSTSGITSRRPNGTGSWQPAHRP